MEFVHCFLIKHHPFFEKFEIPYNLNAAMEFPRIQYQTSSNITPFINNY